jgi:polysaccharide export outer membrane protein
MTGQERTPRLKRCGSSSVRLFHLSAPFAVLLSITMALPFPANFAALGSETGGDTRFSANVEAEDPASSSDYRLASGDRLSILVYDQPQLSGEFIIDGGGGILLPLAGAVNLSGLTLAQAQEIIQERFADGILVQPAVSVRITDYRPIFVTGNVRKPGSYRFNIGLSVKAAVAAAGGEGEPIELNFNGAVSDFISAEQRVRELEAEHTFLLMRKARLEAQRDGTDSFVMPLLVGLNRHNVNFELAYSSESDTFLRLAELYRAQIQALQSQRPRIEAEVKAVANQIIKQDERLTIVNTRLADLEGAFKKGLLRKDVLLNQQIEKALVEGQISNLEGQVARLRQDMGELDVKIGDVKAAFLRQTLSELQDASQRLRDVELSLRPARRLLEIKAKAAGSDIDESEYTVRISRVRDGGMITFDATDETMLSPGDIVEIKLKRTGRGSDTGPSLPTQAIRELDPHSSVAQGAQPVSK